jgi:hypothetical protein
MVVVRWMSVNSVMMVMVVMMRASDGSLLRCAGIGWEAERVEGSRGVRHLLFWQAVVMMVMARGSCQYQHGRLRREFGSLTDVRGRDGGGDVGQHVLSLVVCYPFDWRLECSYRPHYRCPRDYLPSI